MKKIRLQQTIVFTAALLMIAACSKEGVTTVNTVNTVDTLLNVTYENGTTSSGINGLNGTDATATDAAYMVSPGANGSKYAVAHKVISGNNGYFSDGNYRSESSTISVARFYPGEERRYEFSLLLKNWPDWNRSQPPTQSNIFQCRVTGDNYVPVMIRLQRNAIQIRRVDGTTATVLADYRPYVNQWVHFRVDVLWSMSNIGYIKNYIKLPGQSDYTLTSQLNNVKTYSGDSGSTSTSGKFGYIKWGVYGIPTGATGIAYHDNIRIIKLPL